MAFLRKNFLKIATPAVSSVVLNWGSNSAGLEKSFLQDELLSKDLKRSYIRYVKCNRAIQPNDQLFKVGRTFYKVYANFGRLNEGIFLEFETWSLVKGTGFILTHTK